MSMWRQYIVLRGQSGRTAQGFVKLFFTHQACNVSASLSRIQKGSYTLYIWDGDRLRQWEMCHNGRELRLQVKTELQNARIEAAIVDQGGQLVALGESCDPRADWIHMQARIRTQRQLGEGKANEQAHTAPASITQPVHSHKEEKRPESQAEGPSEEMHNTGYTFPLSPGAEGSATLSAQQGDKWQMETLQRKEREEEQAAPLIETLLQQAQPMQEPPAESEAQTALDVEEISRLIHQELQGQDAEAKEPVIIATEHNAGEKATEQLAQQIAEAISEPMQPEEEPVAEEELEKEEGPAQPFFEKEAKAAPAQESVLEAGALRGSQIRETPMSETQENPVKEEIQGPALGGEYAGQWKWKRVEAPSRYGYYLLGCVERKGISVAMAVAVPGEYAPQPPAYLQGFSIYRDGYWVLAQDGETGRTLAV